LYLCKYRPRQGPIFLSYLSALAGRKSEARPETDRQANSRSETDRQANRRSETDRKQTGDLRQTDKRSEAGRLAGLLTGRQADK
jgi:hypothetical protein